jgi:hypothetical protein
VYRLRSKLVSYRQPYSTHTAQPSPDPQTKLPPVSEREEEGEREQEEEMEVTARVQTHGEDLNDSTETIDLDRDRRESDGKSNVTSFFLLFCLVVVVWVFFGWVGGGRSNFFSLLFFVPQSHAARSKFCFLLVLSFLFFSFFF